MHSDINAPVHDISVLSLLRILMMSLCICKYVGSLCDNCIIVKTRNCPRSLGLQRLQDLFGVCEEYLIWCDCLQSRGLTNACVWQSGRPEEVAALPNEAGGLFLPRSSVLERLDPDRQDHHPTRKLPKFTFLHLIFTLPLYK